MLPCLISKYLENSFKIPKNNTEEFLTRNIEMVPDILQKICEQKKQHQVFVGFCAFTGSIHEVREIIKEKIIKKGCDYLFANPIDIKGQGFGFYADNEGWLFDKENLEKHLKKTSKIDLADKLINQIISINK